MASAVPSQRPWSERTLDILTVTLGVLAVAFLGCWIPHYLTWPWWPDLDHYATLALGWKAGFLPYRDRIIFNTPGHLYLHWILGTLFGWGRTAPVYVFDVALLLVVGGALVAWSRRLFGRSLPGLAGFVAILACYLDLDYAYVAQRDWHGPVLAFLGLLAVQAVPGLGGRVVSALLFAAGATIRPHVVLFLPGLAVALIPAGTDLRQRGVGAGAPQRVRVGPALRRVPDPGLPAADPRGCLRRLPAPPPDDPPELLL